MPPSDYQNFVDKEVRPVLAEWLNERMPILIKETIDQEIKSLSK